MCKKKFVCQLTTRYAETDQMGVIHHGNYATYFELARIEWLRSLGLSYGKLETQGILLPVLSLSIEFKQPLHFENQIQIEIFLDKDPTSIVDFSYQIFNQNNELTTEGATVLAFLNSKSMKPQRCPKIISELF